MAKLIRFMAVFMFITTGTQAMQVQGHRGDRSNFPENTLPAFQAAIQEGVDVLELDLHLSQDKAVVIHHDFEVVLENNERALIHNLTLKQIKTIDCGSKTDKQFPQQNSIPGTKIPTLDELLAMIQSSKALHAKKIRLNLEIKRDPRHPELSESPEVMAKTIVSKVKKAGFANRVYYSSFDPEVLKAIRQFDSKAELAFLFCEESYNIIKGLSSENPLDQVIKLARSFQAKILSPEHHMLSDVKTVQRLQKEGFYVILWTVNSTKDWKIYKDWGVDGLITDYPKDLIQFLKNTSKN